MAKKNGPVVETPLSEPVAPEVAAAAEASREEESFLATPEWLNEQKVAGLRFEHAEKPLWIRGGLVYVIDRKSYLAAKREKEMIHVRTAG
jgi:hypothetical protein